jgi:phosphoglycolate phosphatase-like HAD superfamily hydrolase
MDISTRVMRGRHPLTVMVGRVIRVVVVDVDDTLCLTEAACFDLENEVLTRLGSPPMTRQVHLATWGQPLREAIVTRSPGVDVAAFTAEFNDVFRRHLREGLVDVIPGENLRALDRLAAAGRTIMILTSRTLAEVEHLLDQQHVLASRVSAAFHADNTGFRKPDPRVFDELIAATGLTPHQCVYVGDSPGDAAAAEGAGLYFIACLQSGLRQRPDFDALGVDGFIDAVRDLPEALVMLEQAAKPM